MGLIHKSEICDLKNVTHYLPSEKNLVWEENRAFHWWEQWEHKVSLCLI